MSSVDERLSTLEANDKTLFQQIGDLKEDVRDIRRLTIAVEKIAGKVDNIDSKVNCIVLEYKNVTKHRWNIYKQSNY